uniref:Uncharacterized protein n=1 Tax=Romanomermis culicivorax TaxID=13658 RepID=A0A915ISC5_ROMCU
MVWKRLTMVKQMTCIFHLPANWAHMRTTADTIMGKLISKPTAPNVERVLGQISHTFAKRELTDGYGGHGATTRRFDVVVVYHTLAKPKTSF